MNQEIDKKQISYSPGKSSRQKYHSALQFACYLSLRLLAATLVVGCGGSHTAGTGGGSTTGSTSGSGGNGGSQGLAAPSNFEATSDVVRTVHLSWVDNSVAESGYKVVRNGYIVATLPENANSYQDSPVLPDTA